MDAGVNAFDQSADPGAGCLLMATLREIGVFARNPAS